MASHRTIGRSRVDLHFAVVAAAAAAVAAVAVAVVVVILRAGGVRWADE